MTRKKRPIPKGRRHLHGHDGELLPLNELERQVVALFEEEPGEVLDDYLVAARMTGHATYPRRRIAAMEVVAGFLLEDLQYRGLVESDKSGWFRLTSEVSDR